MRQKCIYHLSSSFIIVFLAIVTYPVIFQSFIELFNEARLARYLIGAVFVPSLLVVTSISLGAMFSACCFFGCDNLKVSIRVFGQRFLVVLVPGILGALLGLALGRPTWLSVRLFFIDLIIGGVYVIAVLIWFFVLLPDLISRMGSYSRSLLYWLLSLLLASWFTALARVILANAIPALSNLIINPDLSDPILSDMVRKYTPSYVEAVTAPLWTIIAPLIYYEFLKRRR